MEERRSREQYLNSLEVGNIVAFQIGEKMYSGKIHSIFTEPSNSIVVKTKNGSVYYIEKEQITWVKNGTHWPQGIYNALKLSD